MERIDLTRYVTDKDYQKEMLRQMRHDLAVKLSAAWKRVKENKRRNGGIYIPER